MSSNRVNLNYEITFRVHDILNDRIVEDFIVRAYSDSDRKIESRCKKICQLLSDLHPTRVYNYTYERYRFVKSHDSSQFIDKPFSGLPF